MLVDAGNAFQRLLAKEAASAAARAGFGLIVRGTRSGGYELGEQLRLLDAWLSADQVPEALLVLSARDRGLERAVREAAPRGVHWVGLNHSEDDLEAVRRDHPDVVVSTVCPDERETGRLQARIVRTLLPAGGRVLLVTGHRRSLTARERAAGFEEGLTAAPHATQSLAAGWSETEGFEAVSGWLRIALRARRRLEAVVCQNDALAEGALRALETVRLELGMRGLQPPVIGCDGIPGQGLAMVDSGRLAATVVLPRSAATAVGLLAGALQRGTPMPAFTPLAGTCWPDRLLRLPATA